MGQIRMYSRLVLRASLGHGTLGVYQPLLLDHLNMGQRLVGVAGQGS